MERCVAFLRAINVGGHTVKMDRLRALFEELGLQNVETFIASGNVIFDAPSDNIPALEKQIEAHLLQALGYEVATFIRSGTELKALAAYPAFPAEAGAGLYIAFLSTMPAEDAQRKLQALQTPTDEFKFHGRELYWLCRTRSSDSAFSGAVLEKTIRMPATLRNITTVEKLAAKFNV